MSGQIFEPHVDERGNVSVQMLNDPTANFCHNCGRKVVDG